MEQHVETGIETLSHDLLAAVKAQRETYEDTYYVPLAEQTELPEADQTALRDSVQAEVASLKRASGNLIAAQMQTTAVANELETRLKEGKRSEKRKLLFRRPPANSVIDLKEEQTGHFAQGTNIYKIILLMLVGSFAGVVVELGWCMAKYGYLESRSALLYGPFNPLYGVGAVALTLTLYRFRNRSSIYSFLGGMAVGSLLEYLCSWAQETAFGSTSWDYSAMPFNLNGRICLLYSLFWGILGAAWIKSIYPRVAKLILKIPNRGGKALSWALALFLTVDCAVTLAAVDRWSERVYGEPAAGAADTFLDAHYPDERMERVFANMEFGGAAEDARP